MLENTNSIGVLAMAAGGVAGLAMLAGIAVSLWKARSLVHKEFFSYFLSPIAYAVLVVFLGVQGWLVAGTLDLLLASGPRGVEWPLQFWLSSPVFWLVFLAACPLLTMRTFAEEKASGTLEMLMTSPLSDWQIVLAKYAGCLLFYTVLWLPTVVYLPVLGGVNVSWAGGLPHVVATADLAPVYTTYLGLFLAGAMFLAMGVCVSSMVRDQLVAAQASLEGAAREIIARPDWLPGRQELTTLFTQLRPGKKVPQFSRTQINPVSPNRHAASTQDAKQRHVSPSAHARAQIGRAHV
mgnify:CR=1 FL=1